MSKLIEKGPMGKEENPRKKLEQDLQTLERAIAGVDEKLSTAGKGKNGSADEFAKLQQEKARYGRDKAELKRQIDELNEEDEELRNSAT